MSDSRRKNLNELVREAGSQVAVAQRIGKDKNQIHQWLLPPDAGGARNIGDSSARMLEAAFDKPRGWLDRDHDVYATNSRAPAGVQTGELISHDHDDRQSYAGRLDPTTLAYARDLMFMHYTAHGMDFRFFDDPEMLQLAYDYAADIADRSRLVAFTAALTERVKKAGESARGSTERDAGSDGVLRGGKGRGAGGGRRA